MTVAEKQKLLAYAAEINERDDEDINKMNEDADNIHRSAMQAELAKKDEKISELEARIEELERDAEMAKILYERPRKK